MMNVAVVGANGFIGRHLTETLARDKDIRLFLFGRSDAGSFGSRFPYAKIDLYDPEKIKAAFAGMDVVYYLISESIPSSSWEKPLLEVERNLVPFITFMETVARQGIKKAVFVSSAGTIYGASSQKVNENSDKKPFSPYGITKITMEYYLNYFEVKYGMHYDVYRVSNVYGSGQDTSRGLGIINTFLEKIITEKRIQIFGDGQNIRNYIYVNDVAELLGMSVRSDLNTSGIYNLSSNDTLSINQLVSIIQGVVDEEFGIEYRDTRQSDNSAIYLDNSKILQARPGFKFSAIEEGILKTYTAMRRSSN